jgi:hypothetical protein
MADQQQTWAELSERLEALGLKLRLHVEQAREDQVPEAMGRLRQGVREAFDAVEHAVSDEAVRADVRDVARLLADAVAGTLDRVGADIRDRTRRP